MEALSTGGLTGAARKYVDETDPEYSTAATKIKEMRALYDSLSAEVEAHKAFAVYKNGAGQSDEVKPIVTEMAAKSAEAKAWISNEVLGMRRPHKFLRRAFNSL